MAGNQPGKTKLLVLYGGRSAEHDISCVSALHVVNALDPDRYDIRVVGITTEGRWIDATSEAISAAADPASGATRALPSPDTFPAQHDLEPFHTVKPPQGDVVPTVVLPLLHGPMGEDGTVQGLLEIAGVPYCGAGVAGSAAAMDKGLAKSLLASAGIPQAGFVALREGDALQTKRLLSRLSSDLGGWPVFVKPANMGSSIGISYVHDKSELSAAVELARRYDEFVVIEEGVRGARELEIGVLGWPELRTSMVGEIKPSHEFYDFEDKYLDGGAALEVPASVPDEIVAEMSHLAIAACQALRVDCMARVDFFWDQGGRGLLVNEVNTIPGFTPISMYPRMWAASGVPYPRLVDELVSQARRRARRRSRFESYRSSH